MKPLLLLLGLSVLFQEATPREFTSKAGEGFSGIAFSPDGRILAAGLTLSGQSVVFWDCRTGKELAALEEKPPLELDVHGIPALAFSPDGRKLAVSYLHGGVKIWSLEFWEKTASAPGRRPEGEPATPLLTTKEIAHLGGKGIATALAFSPDGKSLAIARCCRQNVRLWCTTTWKEVRTLSAKDPFNPLSLHFSADGKNLACATANHCIRIWNPVSGRLVATLGTPQEGPPCHFVIPDRTIRSAVFHPDGKSIASVTGADGEIRLWDLRTREVIRFLPHTVEGKLYSAIFSPDGKKLFSSGLVHTRERGREEWSARIKQWDPATGKQTRTFEFGSKGLTGCDRVGMLALSPDGKTLAAISANKILLWTVEE